MKFSRLVISEKEKVLNFKSTFPEGRVLAIQNFFILGMLKTKLLFTQCRKVC